MKRDFISLQDISSEELTALLDSAAAMKRTPLADKNILADKNVGLIFQKPSNRTRVSFEVGVRQLGGNCIYLGPDEINLGKRESTSDVAHTLSRYLNAIVARTYTHEDVAGLARFSAIPVVNGLSDLYHPCQALADLMSVREKFGCLAGLTMAYIGDGNNVCHSLMLGCALAGLKLKIACPPRYEPNPDVVTLAGALLTDDGARCEITSDPASAARGAHVLYADVWTSMGQEAEAKKRLKDFENYQINAGLAALAHPDYIFMHCLPAHRGEEVTAEIIDGPHSIVFDQAENRLHVQKAILKFLLT